MAALIYIMLIEAVHRNSFKSACLWIKERPGDYALNALLFIALEGLFTAASGAFFTGGCIAAVLCLTLAAVGFFKRAARNEPLYFSDIFLAFKVMGVAGASNIIMTPRILISLAAGTVIEAGISFLPLPDINTSARVVIGVVSLFVILMLTIKKSDDFTYRRKGFLRGFVLNIALYFEKPAMPSDDFLPQSTQRNTKKSEEQGLRPNVIAILSESFFDIQRLKNLELERDPLPFFHSIKDRARTGTLLVTPLGGGTCAVEAEFLTGVCGRFFNITKPFYYSVAKRPIPSLASHFKGLGYEARAVHTFNKTFYNREQALNNMGFDSFAGAEDFINPPKDGYYISDAFLTDKVIETFKNKKAKAFIFSISMENHQPYSPDKYPETAVKIKNGIPGRLKREAETYIHALTHADREIKRLVEFVDSQAEPTVLLYFGDHLGAIGPELAFYKEMGYINSGETTDDILALYSPDFFITCNFHNDISIKKTDYSYIGANFMAKILLDYVGGGKSEPFAAMDEAFSCVRSLSRDDVYIDGAGRPVTVLEGEALEAAEYLRMAGYRAMGYGKKG